MATPNIGGGQPPELSPAELTRYSRHLILPEVGYEGQKKLKNSRVLIVGTGGLGAPLSMYLAAAGVGTIGLVDFDKVEESNLQRQIIHGTRDIGRPKTASAKDSIRAINPYVNIETFDTKLTSENALDIIKNFDIVADGTDNFPTRYLVNDACVILKKPNIYGSIYRFEGQASVFAADAPCYRCLFREPPPAGLVATCSEGGILGAVAGIMGCIQTNETIKTLLGIGESLKGRLLLFDSLAMQFREVKIKKNPDCPVCGEHPTVTELIDYEEFCGLKQSLSEESVGSLTVWELEELLEKDPENVQIIDIREPYELDLSRVPRSISIPFGELVSRRSEINTEKTVVFVCKAGTKSILAARALNDAGVRGKFYNLQDGINSWVENISPNMIRY